MATNLNTQRFVLDTGLSGITLKVTMNRYRPLRRIHRAPEDPGHILFFAHGTGFHKELWEPTIEHLFQADKDKDGPIRILEAWAIDYQNHGEAAALNDDVFMKHPDIFNIHEYADAFVKLYRSGLLGKITKSVQKLVLVGHSAGAMGMLSTTALFDPVNTMPFDMVVLVDPPLFSAPFADKMTDLYRIVEKTTPSRRSIWKNKEEAHEWLKARVPWKFWDPRVLKLYAEHGLRDLPTPFHPNKTGVVLCCSPAHETAMFRGGGGGETQRAMEHMNRICGSVPFHIIFGARNDMFSREAQDSVPDPSVGRVIASIRRVKGAGHLVAQEKPDALADAIWAILYTNGGTSKL